MAIRKSIALPPICNIARGSKMLSSKSKVVLKPDSSGLSRTFDDIQQVLERYHFSYTVSFCDTRATSVTVKVPRGPVRGTTRSKPSAGPPRVARRSDGGAPRGVSLADAR